MKGNRKNAKKESTYKRWRNGSSRCILPPPSPSRLHMLLIITSKQVTVLGFWIDWTEITCNQQQLGIEGYFNSTEIGERDCQLGVLNGSHCFWIHGKNIDKQTLTERGNIATDFSFIRRLQVMTWAVSENHIANGSQFGEWVGLRCKEDEEFANDQLSKDWIYGGEIFLENYRNILIGEDWKMNDEGCIGFEWIDCHRQHNHTEMFHLRR